MITTIAVTGLNAGIIANRILPSTERAVMHASRTIRFASAPLRSKCRKTGTQESSVTHRDTHAYCLSRNSKAPPTTTAGIRISRTQ